MGTDLPRAELGPAWTERARGAAGGAATADVIDGRSSGVEDGINDESTCCDVGSFTSDRDGRGTKRAGSTAMEGGEATGTDPSACLESSAIKDDVPVGAITESASLMSSLSGLDMLKSAGLEFMMRWRSWSGGNH